MRLGGKIALGAGAVVLMAVAGIGALVVLSGRPTTGAPIGTYGAPRSALLVIDVQEDFTGPDARRPYADADRLVGAIGDVIARAEAGGAEVLFVRNVVENPVSRFLQGGINAPGDPGIEVDRRIRPSTGDRVFDKGRGDAFSNPALDAYLRERQVDRVVVVGLDARWCVSSTVGGALNRGYRVTVVTDAVAAAGGGIEGLADGWRDSGARAVPARELEW